MQKMSDYVLYLPLSASLFFFHILMKILGCLKIDDDSSNVRYVYVCEQNNRINQLGPSLLPRTKATAYWENNDASCCGVPPY